MSWKRDAKSEGTYIVLGLKLFPGIAAPPFVTKQLPAFHTAGVQAGAMQVKDHSLFGQPAVPKRFAWRYANDPAAKQVATAVRPAVAQPVTVPATHRLQPEIELSNSAESEVPEEVVAAV